MYGPMISALPVKLWEAKLTSVQAVGRDVEGILALLPHYKVRYARYMGVESLPLDITFCCYRPDMQRVIEAAKPGQHLLVSGFLNKRYTNYTYKKNGKWKSLKYEYNLAIQEAQIDPHEGKRGPLCASLQSSSVDEFLQTTEYRFDENCAICKQETIPVFREDVRFCPNCEV